MLKVAATDTGRTRELVSKETMLADPRRDEELVRQST
jgi:hypothetical protein